MLAQSLGAVPILAGAASADEPIVVHRRDGGLSERGVLESLGPDALHHLGVCVGMPVDSVELLIDPLDELGVPTGLPTSEPGLLGEVRVRAAHQRLGYDRLWHTTHLASPADGWHATGDIGAVDPDDVTGPPAWVTVDADTSQGAS